MDNGAFPPLQLFKHATQVYYSKTKGGVDGATKQRAMLRSSTSHLKWEQKIVSQTLKTVAINAFLAWRMFKRQEILQSDTELKSLESFRNSLNRVQATADFMSDIATDLLNYASTLHDDENRNEDLPEGITGTEKETLISMAKVRKRKRLGFFNSSKSVKLRLSVYGHQPKQGSLLYCVLC